MNTDEDVVKDLPIRQFKLMNGDEIIALVTSMNESNYIVDRPFKINKQHTNNDSYQLIPWFDLSLSNRFTIDKSMVVAHANVTTSIKETYIKFAVPTDLHSTPPHTDEPELIQDDELPILNSSKSDIIH